MDQYRVARRIRNNDIFSSYYCTLHTVYGVNSARYVEEHVGVRGLHVAFVSNTYKMYVVYPLCARKRYIILTLVGERTFSTVRVVLLAESAPYRLLSVVSVKQFFHNLPSDTSLELSLIANIRKINMHEKLASEGDGVTSVFFVFRGECLAKSTAQRGEKKERRFGPGEIVGW